MGLFYMLDGVPTSVAFKGVCRVATTANITLSGLQTIDGVTVSAYDRVLVKDQTTGANNGIYLAASGAWRRAADWDTTGDVIQGTAAYVTQGSTNPGIWVVTTVGTITIGTTAVTIDSFLTMTVGERDKLSRFVMVTDPAFGALGDGVTDDSAAIQAADTYAESIGATLIFPDGVYPAAELDQTTAWHMMPGAKILYNGASFGECIRCSATGLKGSRITIDGDGLEPRTVYYVDGEDNEAVVHVENVVSTDQAWIVRSVYVTGDKNKITATFKDLVNDGNDNDSSPQGLVTDETATLNDFPLVHGDNVRSVVVNAGTGKNLYGIVRGIDCKDNAFYSVAGEASVGTVIYDGDDNVCGFRSDANVTIGDIHVLRSGSTSVFFGDCGNITIGDIHVHRNSNAVLHLNAADTGHIKIGSIKGRLYNTSLFAMPSSSGDVDMLTIGEVDVVVEVDDVGTFSPASFMNLTACKGVNLGRIKVDVLLDGISSSTFFYCDFNATFTYRSFIDSIRVGLYEADGVTVHTTCAFFARNMTQSLAYITEGALDSNSNLRSYNYTPWQPGRLVAAAIPTAGTFRRGQIIWLESPTSTSAVAMICVTAGTPGTWELIFRKDITDLTAPIFTNNTDNASVEALRLQGDRATPANNDAVYQSLYLSNTSGTQIESARIAAKGTALTAASETSELRFSILASGSLLDRLYLRFSKLAPTTNDSLTLGSSTEQWADLFLATGGEIRVNNVQMLDTVGGLSTQTAAATAIAAVGNAINTANKRAGKMVFDTTNNRLMIATGSAAADPWYYADGSASVTPA